MDRYVAGLEEVSHADVALVGGKGANLGELLRAGLPVPPGFVVTADAYLRSVDESGVRSRLHDLFVHADPDDLAALDAVSAELQELVATVAVPEAVREAIVRGYADLGHGDDVAVAVRSSATSEDTAGFSFAGMHQTFTSVRGVDAVVARVRDCWRSLYRARVVSYRRSQGLVEEPTIAVVVQRMIRSDRAGVMFTADPMSGDRSHVVIEAARGLGELVVSGAVEPDTYVVAKEGPRLLETHVGFQTQELRASVEGDDQLLAVADPGTAPVLTDAEVLDLARLALVAERHYGEPQDMEWAIADGTIAIVQSRPITTLGATAPEATGDGGLPKPLVQGLGAAPGLVAGPVRILMSVADAPDLAPGEVLVAPMTTPDWVPALRQAAALVTDGGGITCHAAIVSRELRVPCVVGTRVATRELHDGQLVTVDAAAGRVYPGDVRALLTDARRSSAVANATGTASGATRVVPTQPETLGTALYVNLASPDEAETVAALPVDGVGLLRAEFLLLSALDGVHPQRMLADGRRQDFVQRLTDGLLRITRPFAPRPVIYRTTDFRSNEFRGLGGRRGSSRSRRTR